jgi:ferredoxin
MGVSVVYHQPVKAEERALAIEAMESCPMEAIRREGS